jgi:Ankyrin repeats (3 copies)
MPHAHKSTGVKSLNAGCGFVDQFLVVPALRLYIQFHQRELFIIDPNQEKYTLDGTDLLTVLASRDQDGDREIALKLINEDKIDPNRPNTDGDPPLHCAASWDHPGMIDLLINNGARVDEPDNLNETALHVGINNLKVTYALLNRNANPRLMDKHGQEPLQRTLELRLPLHSGLLLNARNSSQEYWYSRDELSQMEATGKLNDEDLARIIAIREGAAPEETIDDLVERTLRSMESDDGDFYLAGHGERHYAPGRARGSERGVLGFGPSEEIRRPGFVRAVRRNLQTQPII